MRTVELTTAYRWICEECARENFLTPRRVELTDEDLQELRREVHELDDWQTLPSEEFWEVSWLPEKITCPHCRETFHARLEEQA